MQQLLNGIKNVLNGNIGINFHNYISTVFYYGFRDLNIKYVKTKQLGGDGGIDGYLEKENIYFAFSSDTLSTLKKVLEKFEGDLNKALNTILIKGQYTGKIEKFIFIYNTHNMEKHNDKNNELTKIANKLFEEYSTNIEYEIWNVDDVMDFVYEKFSENGIKRIIENLNIEEYVRTPNFINDVRDILNGVEDCNFDKKESNWKRKSTQKKIISSGLEEIKENINAILTNVDWYTKLEKIILDEFYTDKFENLKNKIIELYDESDKYGVDKFEEIIDNLHRILWNSSRQSCRLLVIYILDNCDIFNEEVVL